jgi:hypothetical protein
VDPFQKVNPQPPTPNLQDELYKQKLEKNLKEAAARTAALGAVQRIIPGVPGKLFGTLVSGLEKDAGSGRVSVGKGTALNLAPAPLGFLDAELYGLRRNFYLPAGVSEVIPPALNKIVPGLPEQRKEDELRKFHVGNQHINAARATVQGEQLDTLQQLAAGTGGPFTRASVLRATTGLDFQALASAAQLEIDIREGRVPRPAPAESGLLGSTAPIPAGSAPVLASGPGAPVPAGGSGSASIQPEGIQPVNDAAKRNEDSAKGIRRQLVSERADP